MLHVSPEQNSVERIAQFIGLNTNGIMTNLPGGRILLLVPTAKGDHLMLVNRGGERVPLAGALEWASPPATLAGPGQIACLIGPEPLHTIALITIDTQTITRRIPFDKGKITSLVSVQ